MTSIAELSIVAGDVCQRTMLAIKQQVIDKMINSPPPCYSQFLSFGPRTTYVQHTNTRISHSCFILVLLRKLLRMLTTNPGMLCIPYPPAFS